MAVRHHANDHRRDLLVAAVDERIADLRAAARASRTPRAGADRGVVSRLRDALGARLIALGAALATDDPLRRRPALRS